MVARNKVIRLIWKWFAPLAAVAALALACFLYFYAPGQKAYRLSLTAGNALGMRHRLAQRLEKDVSSRGLVFASQPSQGSEQALDWVNNRNVDVALVQGGLTATGRANVRQVAALHIEPLHLAVKKELVADASTSLMALGGKTVDLGEVGSGTHSLAFAALEFVGLKPRATDPARGYIPLTLDRQHLFAEKDTSRLPDAVFLVSLLPSATIRYLVTKHGYRLVPLPFAEALALEALEEPALIGRETHERDAGGRLLGCGRRPHAVGRWARRARVRCGRRGGRRCPVARRGGRGGRRRRWFRGRRDRRSRWHRRRGIGSRGRRLGDGARGSEAEGRDRGDERERTTTPSDDPHGRERRAVPDGSS